MQEKPNTAWQLARKLNKPRRQRHKRSVGKLICIDFKHSISLAVYTDGNGNPPIITESSPAAPIGKEASFNDTRVAALCKIISPAAKKLALKKPSCFVF